MGASVNSSCSLLSDVLSRSVHGALLTIAVQSLMIAGWVAMSRPLEIYLYEWWPLRKRGQIFEKLSRMRVGVRKRCDLE